MGEMSQPGEAMETTRKFGKRQLGRVILWMALAALLAMPAGSQAPAPGRIVAIGDVHGDYDALVGILQQARLIDANRNWNGGKATLVQTGDFLDRGPKVREVMDLLMALEKEAPKKGGRVVVLLGNHEVMNIIGDLRDVSGAAYASFATPDSERKRAVAAKARWDWQKAQGAADGPPAISEDTVKARWLETHLPGFVEHREAFGRLGKYGKWLRGKPAVAQIAGTVFLHGGISPALASWRPIDVNTRVRDEIALFDRAIDQMMALRWIPIHSTLQEVVEGAQTRLDQMKAEAARHSTRIGPGKQDEIAEERRQIKFLEDFLGLQGWLVNHPEGPLWFRGYALWGDEEGAPKAAEAFKALGISQMVIGHTPQTDGRIRARFGGKVFLIDTGMYTGYYKYGRASALEIDKGKFTAIYSDQRIVLLDPAAPPAARPGSDIAGENEDEGLPGGGMAEHGQGAQGTSSKPAAEKRSEPPKKATPQAPAKTTTNPAKGSEPAEGTARMPAESPRLAPTASKLDTPGLSRQREPASAAAAGVAPAAGAGRAPGTPHVWIGPEGKPLPFKTAEEVQEFLRTAKIVKMRDIPTGITQPRKARLEKDGIAVNAVFRDINMEKDVARLATGGMEMFFRDSYIFENAAYELAMMLGLDTVPPVVRRTYNGTDGSLQIWVENAMRETDRQQRKIPPPDAIRWNRQVQVMRIFDQLIYNTDRNMGNILIDPDWRLWMIDHTRAFRRHESLREPIGVALCERGLYDKMKSLNSAEAKQRLRPYLREFEIEGILKRRDKVIQYIDKLARERGEEQVFFSW